MNLIYKLTDRDYIEMYPFFTPNEIKEEFGKRSKTARAITMLYDANGLKPVREERREAFLKSFSCADTKYSADDWARYISESMKERRQEIRKLVWSRIAQYEGSNNGRKG